MSQDDLFGAPAGWYPDPLGLPQLRWWNNHAWTEQTSAARQPMVVQDTKFAWADDDLPSRRDERERERSRGDRATADTAAPTAETLRELEPPRAFTQVNNGASTATAAPTAPAAPAAPAQPAAFVPPMASTAPPAATAAPATPAPAEPASRGFESFYQPDPVVEPAFPAGPTIGSIFDSVATPSATVPDDSLNALFGARESRTMTARVRTPIMTATQTTVAQNLPSATGPAWVIAMVPLFQLVLSLLILNAFGMAASSWIFIGILVVPYFLVIGLAYFDYTALKNAGHPAPAHWAWAALSAPVYLLVRARAVIRETGHGIGPVLVWFGLGFLHLASVIAVPGVLIALLPAVFTAQIEQSIQSDAMLIASRSMTVSCEGNPPVLAGEQMICNSISSSGNQTDIKVALQRSNGWISWQVLDWGSVRVAAPAN